MQENSRYATGIDIGTSTIRCVVAHIDENTGLPTIIGVGKAKNSGMRKGTVVNLDGPARAIDSALAEAERMSGYLVNSATVSINGSHIISTHADGMIAVGAADHVIEGDDISRIEEVATIGKVPANRQIIQVIPHSYKLDGQDKIKNPIGMTGTRLEIDALIVSALMPNFENLQKASESAKVAINSTVVAGVAAARAVLTETQIENGVALVDIGDSTTNLAIYEEGDLQYFAVIPMGGVSITNDLAIGLKTDPSIAEIVKTTHASAIAIEEDSEVSVEHENVKYDFDASLINEIVEARLEELFELIQKELKRAGRDRLLPSGIILTGGTAKLNHIAEYAKKSLKLAAKVGVPSGFGGVVDEVNGPEYATAIGLMLIDSEFAISTKKHIRKQKKKSVSGGVSVISKFFNKFKP